MLESLRQESEKLARSWMRHDQEALRDYLIADVEDPRLNVSSLISRQFLITALGGGRFQELMDHELRFAVAMNWLLGLTKRASGAEEFQAVRHGFQRGADDAEGIEIPRYLLKIFSALPASLPSLAPDSAPTSEPVPVVPNYLLEVLAQTRWQDGKAQFPAGALDTFQRLWRAILSHEPRPQPAPRVLEAACGSANDYRFLETFGLARLIDYTGFDLCEKNVLNARALFPMARFEVGNVFAIAAPDKSFDYVFAHDLFEHLSLEGLDAAVGELCRVARRGLCLGFFNLDERADHLVRPVEEYHWNTLSVDRLREAFEQRGFSVQVVHVGSFLRWATGCDRTHNENAYSFLLRA
ncbi:MAG: class I SAM-dependent methyltransferase [Verrucomicrobia bacterium]|nr:class I SAM-dependent methyltransferase [Verrucomicrobiota bacterium]